MNINSVSNLMGNVLLNELNKSSQEIAGAFEKLASGRQINRASDDPAGLAIVSRLEAQERGLAMAERNAQMGVSMAQTAEGYLGSVTEDVQRIRELSVQAGNGTLNSSDRDAIQQEIDQLRENVDYTLSSAEFNGKPIFNGETQRIQVGPGSGDYMDIKYGTLTADSLGLDAISVQTQTGADAAIASSDASLTRLLEMQTNLGASQSRLESTIDRLAQTRTDTMGAMARLRDTNMAEEMIKKSAATNRLESQLMLMGQVNKINRGVIPLLLGD